MPSSSLSCVVCAIGLSFLKPIELVVHAAAANAEVIKPPKSAAMLIPAARLAWISVSDALGKHKSTIVAIVVDIAYMVVMAKSICKRRILLADIDRFWRTAPNQIGGTA